MRRFYGQASTEPLDGRERACGFHWRQSLLNQSKKHITPAFREAHVRMCTSWFDSKTIEEAEVQFAIIRGWWTLREPLILPTIRNCIVGLGGGTFDILTRDVL